MTVRVLACRRGASRARRVDMTGFCSYVVGGAAERQKVVYAVPPDSSNWGDVLVVNTLTPVAHNHSIPIFENPNLHTVVWSPEGHMSTPRRSNMYV